MMKTGFNKLKQVVFNKLERELPGHLYYHSIAHTTGVLRAAARLAGSENISEYEQLLLATAVLFHDTGFIIQSEEHENESCGIAIAILPEFDYSQEEILVICKMIMATRIPQRPETLLEMIICDADLDYLGRDDFWTIGQRLYREIIESGRHMNPLQWNQLQVKFLEEHHYFTHTAKTTREPKKQLHLKKLKKILLTM